MSGGSIGSMAGRQLPTARDVAACRRPPQPILARPAQAGLQQVRELGVAVGHVRLLGGQRLAGGGVQPGAVVPARGGRPGLPWAALPSGAGGPSLAPPPGAPPTWNTSPRLLRLLLMLQASLARWPSAWLRARRSLPARSTRLSEPCRFFLEGGEECLYLVVIPGGYTPATPPTPARTVPVQRCCMSPAPPTCSSVPLAS